MVAGEIVYLIVIYVDDIVLTSSEREREELLAFLYERFPVKDLGDCTLFGGCAIEMDLSSGINKVSQKAYIESVLPPPLPPVPT